MSTLPKPNPIGPRDVIIQAGKVVVLVNDANLVMMYKLATKPIRIFTAYAINTYADEATAQADIKAKGWKYTPEPSTK